MAKNTRKRSALGEPKNEPPVAKGPKKSRLGQKSNPTTAWDAANTQYPVEISSFFPSLASIPDSLTIIKYLAALPAFKGALDYRDHRAGASHFTLELGSKGSIKSGEMYEHFHARNRNSRAQGNLKAVLAQASGSPALVACVRCAQDRTLWKTCMKAATMPGLKKDDTLNGACPGCYYNGVGHCCSNREHTAKNGIAQASLSGAEDGQQSYEATPHASRLGSETPAESASTSHQHAPVQPGRDLDGKSTTGDVDDDKMQKLQAENEMLRLHIDRLQARVDELEDMIEAEEQQCAI